MSSEYILFVGLGNPGPEYESTRHNIGAIFLDFIKEKYARHDQWRNKFDGEYVQFSHNEKRFILLKPTTYMNLSGNAVRSCANFFKIKPGDIVVLHDDIDLPHGKLKLKIGGGTGGHNGLVSIDAQLGSKEYIRLRIGVGRPEQKSAVARYVLSNFTPAELTNFSMIGEKIASNLSLLQTGRQDLLNQLFIGIE